MPFGFIARGKNTNKFLIMRPRPSVATNFFRVDTSFSFPLGLIPVDLSPFQLVVMVRFIFHYNFFFFANEKDTQYLEKFLEHPDFDF